MTVHRLLLPNFVPTSLNKVTRGKRRTGMRLVKGDRDIICYYAMRSGIPPATTKRRVSLVIVLGKGERTCDADAYFKVLFDGLKHAKMLVDDSIRWCQIGDLTVQRDWTDRHTVVVLEEVN